MHLRANPAFKAWGSKTQNRYCTLTMRRLPKKSAKKTLEEKGAKIGHAWKGDFKYLLLILVLITGAQSLGEVNL